MAEYKIIYPFEVFEQVCNGKQVGAVDRLNNEVLIINDLAVSTLAKILNEHKKELTRYEFWIRKENENEQ